VSDETLTGRPLAELKVMEHFHLVITRVRRQGLEIAPTGSLALEMGDVVRVVGETDAVEAFSRAVADERRRDQTNMVPFLAGLALGAAVGMLPIPLGGGVTLRLGLAGGAFLVALLMGHFRRIGRIPLFVPQAARYLARELGLMLFLAGAGTAAGAALWPVLQQQGWSLLLGGAFVTTAAALAGVLLMLRTSTLSAMGVLCAAMTNPPALAAASSQTDCDLPTLSYASAYPVALIFKILLAQVLAGL